MLSLITEGEFDLESIPKELNNLIKNSADAYGNMKGITIYNSKSDYEYIGYDKLYKESFRVAKKLNVLGIDKGKSVILQIDDLKDFIYVFWGCILLKAIPIPLPTPKHTKSDNESIRKLENVYKILNKPVIVVEKNNLKQVLIKDCSIEEENVKTITEVLSITEENIAIEVDSHLESIKNAYIQFSSGSTGIPKGVQLTHENIISSIYQIQKRLAVESEDVLGSWLPLTHNMGMIIFHLLPLAFGCNQILISPKLFITNPELCLSAFTSHKVTIFGAPNFALKWITDKVEEKDTQNIDLSSIRIIINGAEPISVDVVNTFNNKFNNFNLDTRCMTSGYGMSEATIGISVCDYDKDFKFYKLDRNNNRIDDNCEDNYTYVSSVGTPFKGMSVKIVDEDNNIVKQGMQGEILISGPNVTNGYINNEEANKVLFQDGYLRTGDIGIIYDNNILVIGRKKDMIIVNGQKYYSNDLEESISKKMNIPLENIVICGLESIDKLKDDIVAFVKADKEKYNSEEIREKMQHILSRLIQCKIKDAIIVEEIPKTSNGKKQRDKLVKIYYKNDSNKNNEKVEDSIKKHKEIKIDRDIITDKIKNILNIEEIDEEKNFFELGGDSLKLIALIESINSLIEDEIELDDILGMDNIHEVIEFIEKKTLNKCNADTAEDTRGSDTDHIFDLTEIQKAYLLGRGEKMLLGGVCTHAYFEVKTTLELKKLNESLNVLIKNNPMLRAEITENGQQKILDSVPEYNIPILDLRDKDNKIKSQKLSEYRQRLSHNVYDVYKWPLFDFEAVRLNEKESYLFMSIDLIIADGLSIMNILNQLVNIYNGDIEKIDYTFEEYLRNLNTLKDSPKYLKSKKYWTSKLENFQSYPKIPLKKSLRDVQKPKFKRIMKTIDKEYYAKLKNIASENNITASNILCTIFARVLSEWSRTNKFTLNVTTSNRLPVYKNVNKVIGDFTTTILLDVDYNSNESLIVNCNDIKNKIIKGINNSLYDGINVIRDLNAANDEEVIFPIVFTSMLFDNNNKNLKLLGEEVYSLSQTPQVFLDFQVLDKQNNLQLSWDYIEELFEEKTITAMFNQYIDILSSFIDGKDIDKDYFINDNKCLSQYNNTYKSIKETNVINEFMHRVDEYPDKVAIAHKDKKITYGELNTLSGKVALYLKEKGVKAGDYVVVYTKRNIETIANIIGILKSGAAYIPVDEEYPENRKRFILEQSGARTAIGSDIIETVLLLEYSQFDIDNYDNHSSAYCIYTSGSTGRPKGVLMSHSAVMNTIFDVNERFNVTEDDVILGISNQTFDLSVYDIFGTLISGAKLVLIDNLLEVDTLIDTLESEKITIWNSVPAIMEMVIDRLIDKENVNYWEVDSESGISIYKNFYLKLVMLSGDYINVNLPDKIYSKFPIAEVYSLGGATEAGIWSIFYPIREVDKNLSTIPYGYPLSNQQIYILNDELNQQLIGQEGEIYIGGKSLAEGYLNDEEKTRKVFIHHSKYGLIYKTGDYGIMSEKGYVEFCGRKDFQVKINGHRIELTEIEKVINNYKGIYKCVVATKKIGSQVILCGYYISDTEISYKNIRSYLEEYLPEYMIPSCIMKISEIPLSSNKKINKKLLPEPGEQTKTSELIPMTDIAKDILDIWRKVLNRDDIGINDSFFEIGGDSISMVKMLSIIKDKYRKKIDMVSFVSNNTIKSLSKLLIQSESNNDKVITLISDKDNLYDDFPLTNVQTAYYLGRNKGYSMGGVSTHAYYELETELDIKKLNDALQKVIDNNEMLRCVFNNDLTQHFIKECYKYEITTIDISSYSADKQREILSSARKNNSHQVFDPAKWPLFSFTAYKSHEKKHILLISFDLLIADGISMRLFIKELIENYNGQIVRPLDFTFRDYIRGISKLQKGEKYNIDKEYWMEKLDDINNYPKIPMEIALNKIEIPKFKRVGTLISKDEWFRIKEFAKEKGVTTSAFLCTVFSYVMGYWSNQWNMLLNMTTFNRYPFHKDVSKIIGDFTSLLMVNINLNRDISFEDNLKNVQQSIIECLEHNSFDGIMVQRELSKIKKQVNEPIAPIVFTSMIFENNSSEFLADLSQIGDIKYSVSQTSQVFLDVQVMNTNEGLQITWDYVEQLFDSKIIKEMFTQYIELIGSLTSEKPLLLELPQRHRELIHDYNVTDSEIETSSLVNLFVYAACTYPDKVAVSHNNSRITYRELDKKSGEVAAYLVNEGIKTGDFVGVITDRSIQSIINIIGVLKSKAAYVPIDAEYPEERKKYIVNKSRCSCVIDNTLGKNLNLNTVYLSDKYDEDLTAYVIFTSGSTGNPKGVVVKHNSVVNTILDINNKFKISHNDKILNLSSMCFDLSVYDIFGSLCAGAELVLIDNVRDIDNILNILEEKEITLWNSVPQLINMVVERLNLDQSKEINYWENADNYTSNYIYKNYTLKNILLSGDKIPVNLPKEIKKYFPISDICSLGGATEGSIWSIYYPINNFDDSLTSIPYGYPLANQRIYILDEKLEILPTGVQGDIYIGGKGVAEGYFDEDEKNKTSFTMHPKLGKIYKTGDQGIFNKAGYVEFKGRKDFQVKIRGYRVELGEIENAILNYPKVENAVVVNKEDHNGNTVLCAYLVGADCLDMDDIKNHIEKYLPKYMIPSYFKQIPKIPLSHNNKVDKKMLLDIVLNSNEDQVKLPGSRIEQELKYIWEELLSIKNIGVDQNFFDIGGDSIIMIKLFGKLEKYYNVKISISTLLKNLTIREMARLIEGRLYEKSIYSVFNNECKKTIFTFPSVLGLGFIYKELAEVLNDYRIICFDFESKPDLLDIYIDEMEKINGDNSYILLGHSAGGNIAYELASMLEERGRKVEKLILLDSYNNITGDIEYSSKKLDDLINDLIAQYSKQYDLEYNFIKDTIEDFIKFLINNLSIDRINSDIFYIKSEGDLAFMNVLRKYNDEWKNTTNGKFNLLSGFGDHFNMLDGKYIDSNTKLIKNILNK